MANTVFSIQSEDKISCYNSDNPKTVLVVGAPAYWPVKILGFSNSFDGRNVTSLQVGVSVKRMSTSGTTTPVTPVKLSIVPEAAQSTGGVNATIEPTGSDIIEVYDVHPQAGYEVKYPKGEEPIISGGGYAGIVVTASEAVNCRVKMICEE
jgi:hypothetical protein